MVCHRKAVIWQNYWTSLAFRGEPRRFPLCSAIRTLTGPVGIRVQSDQFGGRGGRLVVTLTGVDDGGNRFTPPVYAGLTSRSCQIGKDMSGSYSGGFAASDKLPDFCGIILHPNRAGRFAGRFNLRLAGSER